MFRTFKLSSDEDILAIFGSATVLSYFLQKLGKIFPIFWGQSPKTFWHKFTHTFWEARFIIAMPHFICKMDYFTKIMSKFVPK